MTKDKPVIILASAEVYDSHLSILSKGSYVYGKTNLFDSVGSNCKEPNTSTIFV